MRIGVVVGRLGGGGTAQCVVDLTNGLEASGLHPAVVCLEHRGYLAEAISARVPVIGPLKRTGHDVTAPFRLAAILREHQCDVVHCHNWGALVDAVLAAKLARIRAVLHTQHGLDYGFNQAPDHLRSRLRTRLKAAACRGVARVVTVSQEVARMVTRTWHVPASKVSVVHNGITIPGPCAGRDIRSHLRRELGVGDADLVMGTVATFRPVKDLHTMLAATALVVQKQPRARLVLVGNGPLKTSLESEVDRLGLRSAVRFAGWRTDAARLLPAFDLFVLSSVSEGIPLALLEAMAAGVPVVATRVGGVPEIISEPSHGLLVQPESPIAMAQAMLAVIDNPGRHLELSAGGRARVQEGFSLTRMVKDYEQLYRSLAN